MRCHHRPFSAASSFAEVAIVHTADVISNAIPLGSSGAPFVPPLDPDAWESLGIAPDTLPSIIEETEQKYEDTVNVVLELVK